MAFAALLSGHAINLTRTTACHAVAYGLTRHLGLRHGHACAITLPGFFSFNAAVREDDVQDARGVDHVRSRIRELCEFLGTTTPAAAHAELHALTRRCGLHTRLSPLHADDAVLARIATEFDERRAANNPRRVTAQAVRQILHEVL
jgi:phosphonoacetaldehyde reductase